MRGNEAVKLWEHAFSVGLDTSRGLEVRRVWLVVEHCVIKHEVNIILIDYWLVRDRFEQARETRLELLEVQVIVLRKLLVDGAPCHGVLDDVVVVRDFGLRHRAQEVIATVPTAHGQ